MAKVSYIVNDELGKMMDILHISGYEMIGGHWAFTSEDAYYAAMNAVNDAIWALIDAHDDDDDSVAYGYLDQLEKTNYTVMYWSTEKGAWV